MILQSGFLLNEIFLLRDIWIAQETWNIQVSDSVDHSIGGNITELSCWDTRLDYHENLDDRGAVVPVRIHVQYHNHLLSAFRITIKIVKHTVATIKNIHCSTHPKSLFILGR